MANLDNIEVSVEGGFCTESKAKPCGIVIFGASGDLTHRKLIPALFSMYEKRILTEDFFILGCARSELTQDDFRTKIKNELTVDKTNKELSEFLEHCDYIHGNYDELELYNALKGRLDKLSKKFHTESNIIFYMATPPQLYYTVTEELSRTGLTREESGGKGFRRIIYEKPFGHDLTSAVELNEKLHSLIEEHQIYRIDHYLGKETVQNLLMFRFANSIFEPIWNQNYIDNIQITVAEELGVEHRAGYYDKAGQLRDMFQNHMMQMLSLVAIEPPASFDADSVRDEKVKLMKAIQPFKLTDPIANCIIRGQYKEGLINGKKVPGYTEEKGVPEDSRTETFVAAKILINNWRWKGVPFYLRSGKRLRTKFSEIAITFKKVPHSMFFPLPQDSLSPNVLVMRVQPKEGMSLSIQTKIPGPKICMTSLQMKFQYQDIFGEKTPEPYERLILDCIVGDQTLFWRHDGVKVAWSLLTPVLDFWASNPSACPLTYYDAGTWGPFESELLLKQDSRNWRIPD